MDQIVVVLFLLSIGARQEPLSGDDANLFPDRQSDNDFGKSLQRFLHHHGLNRLCVWNSRSYHRKI